MEEMLETEFEGGDVSRDQHQRQTAFVELINTERWTSNTLEEEKKIKIYKHEGKSLEGPWRDTLI